ncbi:DAK2 domain-containing protein [Catellatospora bangladeshensis]|uniref:Dihydroxyacetone kinase n=1 Tax=Catellatospora bangladeshensis TaxID=310355 RepID=A0A8J3JRX4_9ACTN|nr:DAK2 domain-containing protein [Catellatospora bangladeshensis]GIF83808.1 dihydroxyacetone kinase [Catellatospora bangladeshensis]
MLEVLDIAAVRRWSGLAVAGVRRHEQALNQLNVYPVPDGDTGTNLLLTLTAAEQVLAGPLAEPQSAGALLRATARGALMGARGNSGVITAQWLSGLADSLDGGGLAPALDAAAKAAYAAVARPVEGTILTVARAAADAAHGGSDDAEAVRAAVRGAREALARTPEQLPVLAAAGVVDAGGQGLVLLLEALLEALTGEHDESMIDPAPNGHEHADHAGHGHGGHAHVAAAYRGPAYEVQFLLDTGAGEIADLRVALDRLGDSLVIVGGPATWRVHVHVDDAGAALEAGLAAGRPYQIQVTHLTAPTAAGAPRRPDPTARAVVVTAAGDGIEQLLTAEGAVAVSGNPSTAEVLDAILATGAGRVAVLPTDTNLRAVCQMAAEEAFGEGVKVRVIPTRSPVQALAALAIRDHARRFEDDVIAMAEAAGACRSAEVTTASREALTMAGRCRPGDVIALIEGEVNLIGADLPTVCAQLLDRMLASGGELVTLLTGAQAPDGLVEALTAHVAARWPFVEVHAYEGGQPHYPLLVGVE